MKTKTVPFSKSILFKTMLAAASASLLLNVIMLIFLQYNYSVYVNREFYGRGNTAVRTAATLIDGEDIDRYLLTMQKDGQYDRLHNQFTVIGSEGGLIVLFVARMTEEGMHYVFDTSENAMFSFGELVPWSTIYSNPDNLKAHEDYIKALIAGERVEPDKSDSAFGMVEVIYEPVYRADGSTAGYAGASISIATVREAVGGEFPIFVILAVAIFLSTVSVTFIVIQRNVVVPIEQLTERLDVLSTNDFAYGKIDYDAIPGPQILTQNEFAVLESSIIDMNKRIFDEVRERINISRASLEAAKRVETMFDAMPFCFHLWTKDLVMLDCNKAAAEMFRFKNKQELIRRSKECFPEFQPNGERSSDLAAKLLKRALKSKPVTFDWTHVIPDTGELIPVKVTLARTEYNGEPALAGYAMDTRKEIEAQKQLMESAEKIRDLEYQKQAAEAASDAKTSFLANVSHEIRTPMNVIIGMADLLLSENLNYRQHRYADDIKSSSLSLLSLINDILDVSKIHSAKLTLQPIHFSFKDFIDNIISISEYLIKDKVLTGNCDDLHCRYEIDEDIPEYLYGDDIRLRQIYVNIISNAVKHTSRGIITIKARMEGTEMLTVISDTGSGIPAEDIPRLFDEFEQADRARTRQKQGTGLGLFITKSLVELMNGKIWCESEYGEGSVFSFIIPVTPGDAALVPAAAKAPDPVYAPKASALVVDDRELNLSVIQGLLRQCGIEAQLASSGAQAIDMVKDNLYDIIFMDHMMPDLDGAETTKILRDSGCTVPIVALTANAVSGARELLISSGMDDFLAKPIEKPELYRVLREWLADDKIIEKPAEAQSAKPEADDKKFWDKVGQIEGLSLMAGLDTASGSKNDYKNTLNILKREIIASAIALREFLSSEDMKGFCTEVHGMKGSLALAGATHLAATARELENASREGDIEFCHANLSGFIDALIKLGKDLKEAFSAIDAAAAAKAAGRTLPQELRTVLTRLKDAIYKENLDALFTQIDALNALDIKDEQLGGEINKVIEYTQIMDYNSARALISELLGGT